MRDYNRHVTAATNLNPEDDAHLEELEADEAYWDYLDEMEHYAGGAREWDNA